MKKIVLGMLIGMLLTVGVMVFAEMVIKENVYPIFVDGVKKDVPAYNIDGRTYLQLREIGGLLNVKVDFNDKEEIIIGASAEELEEEGIPIPVYAIDGLPTMKRGDRKYYVACWDIKDKYKGKYAFDLKDDKTYCIAWTINGEDVIYFDSYPQDGAYVELEWYNTILQPWLLEKCKEQ